VAILAARGSVPHGHRAPSRARPRPRRWRPRRLVLRRVPGHGQLHRRIQLRRRPGILPPPPGFPTTAPSWPLLLPRALTHPDRNPRRAATPRQRPTWPLERAKEVPRAARRPALDGRRAAQWSSRRIRMRIPPHGCQGPTTACLPGGTPVTGAITESGCRCRGGQASQGSGREAFVRTRRMFGLSVRQRLRSDM
jgi:hypothetical protein